MEFRINNLQVYAINEDGYGESQLHQAAPQQCPLVTKGTEHCSLPTAPCQDKEVTSRGTAALDVSAGRLATPTQKWDVGEIVVWLRRV